MSRKICFEPGCFNPSLLAFLTILTCSVAHGHDIITTPLTWDREISRIVYARCASCHRQDGSAFPLLTYEQARPWAKSIEEETLERRMPPWGAVKGFGDFRNDQGLTQEQLELISNWVDGGAPEVKAYSARRHSGSRSPSHPVSWRVARHWQWPEANSYPAR